MGKERQRSGEKTRRHIVAHSNRVYIGWSATIVRSSLCSRIKVKFLELKHPRDWTKQKCAANSNIGGGDAAPHSRLMLMPLLLLQQTFLRSFSFHSVSLTIATHTHSCAPFRFFFHIFFSSHLQGEKSIYRR